jgi:hypothetical protein
MRRRGGRRLARAPADYGERLFFLALFAGLALLAAVAALLSFIVSREIG